MKENRGGGAGSDSETECSPVSEMTEDDIDFGRRSKTSDSRQKKNAPHNLTIRTDYIAPKYPETPDSDGDVLGELIEPPNIIDEADLSGDRYNPYTRIFEDYYFDELMPEVYIRDRLVTLKIVDVQPLTSNIKLFNQFLFTITIHHGSSHWTIKRRSKQILSLHTQLRLFKTKIKLPATTSGERDRRQSMRHKMKTTVLPKPEGDEDVVDSSAAITNEERKKVVKLPRKALQRMDSNSTSDVEIYLANLLLHPLLRSHSAVLEFFEISPVSFIGGIGTKLKEGWINKKSRGVNLLLCCGGHHKTRWLVLRESCLFLVSRKRKASIRTVMLMDASFQVSHGFRQTGIRKGLLISNFSRTLKMRCDGDENAKEWASAIDNVFKNFASDFSQTNRHSSFAPVRRKSYARWYVDGSTYMSDVAILLETAKEEIFITDWWLSPDIYMKRPDLTGKEWKLSEILLRQAKRGVRIFILLYKEVELALGLNSFYTKKVLSESSPNIKVLRHPDHYGTNTLYWAHHEKMVIVDQMHAFVGGIDLCYGRWDNYKHKLSDIGHAGIIPVPLSPTFNYNFVNQLVQNTRDMFVAPSKEDNSKQQSETDIVDRQCVKVEVEVHGSIKNNKVTTENPSCDTKLQFENNNKLANNIEVIVNGTTSEHAIKNAPQFSSSISEDGNLSEDTSEINYDKDKNNGLGLMTQNSLPKSKGKVSKNLKAVKTLGMDLVEEVRERGKSIKWPTKTSKLIRSKSFDSVVNLKFSSDSNDEEGKPAPIKPKRLNKKILRKIKMRSKSMNRKTVKDSFTSSLADLHKEVAQGEETSVHYWVGKDYVNWITRDLYDPHFPFNDTVNRHETPRMPWHDIALYVEGPAGRDAARHFIQRWNAIKSEKVKHHVHYPYLIPKTYEPSDFKPSMLRLKYNVSCQVIRSSGLWSAGLQEKENSIFNAYVEAIKNAKHYIYIENQFFITNCNTSSRSDVLNLLGYHLFERIYKAHKQSETFRVFVVLPLLPAFEGQLGTPSGVAMQYILHYMYQSINNGPNSLIGMLNSKNVPWQRYLSFCSLRTYDTLEGQLVSELIYVHSKLLIVDDNLVIAGSANINDRSLLGERDSEVCLLIEDQSFTIGKMNGKNFQSGRFASSLRTFLFNEHLGQTVNAVYDVSDPISDEFFFKTWQLVASKNTKIFEETFNCIPNDSIKTFAQLKDFRTKISFAKSNNEEAKKNMESIQGRLVLYPLLFLNEEDLKPGPNNKEFLLPAQMWT